MNEKKKISPLCLTGCIMSVLSVIALVAGLGLYFVHGSVRLFGSHNNRFFFLRSMIVLAIVLTIAGLILAIRGVITSVNKGHKGKTLGIIGIVIAVLMIIIYLLGAALLVYEDTHRESPPTASYEYSS